MDKRDLLTPLIVAGLALAFVVISALVYLTRGHPGLIRKKLRVGGLLLALTGAVNGCGDDGLCYAIALADVFRLEGEEGKNVHLDLRESDVLSGQITNRQSDRFFFRIEETGALPRALLQQADIAALDGAFDAPTEDFELKVDPTLKTGVYGLTFFRGATTDHESVVWSLANRILEIEND